MVDDDLTTAHESWDRSWRDARARARWSVPDAAVIALVEPLRRRGVRQVADVGCGIGRHALALAREGFTVTATDGSPAGIDELQRNAAAAELSIVTHVSSFTHTPVAHGEFGFVLAWNVLYHGDGDVVDTAFAECRRVLQPSGWFLFTMLSKGNAKYGRGEEIRTDTYVLPGDEGDKAHAHFYVDGDALEARLTAAGFQLLTLDEVDQDAPNGAWHYVALAEAVG